MDGYVAKPIRAHELFETMEQVLRVYAPELLAGRLSGGANSTTTGQQEGESMDEFLSLLFAEAIIFLLIGEQRLILPDRLPIFAPVTGESPARQ